MMDLNGALTFVKVVQSGSFSAAARELKMPVSTVSTKIARLEEELQVSLLRRTTRKLHLTEAGQRYFVHAARAVAEMQQAQSSLFSPHGEPQGTIRVTATVDMGSSSLSDLISEFLGSHPRVKIDLVLTDRVVDLVGEGIDLAIRAGQLKDSSMVSRRVGSTSFEAFASPSYLKKHGTPKKPQQLEEHECLLFSVSDSPSTWEFRNGPKVARIRVKSRLASNSLASLHRLVTGGAGIGLLPTFLCADDLQTGKLVQLFPEWRAEHSPVSIVYPKQSHVPLALRAFADFLFARLGQTIQG